MRPAPGSQSLLEESLTHEGFGGRRLIFGLGSEARNNVHYLDESTVAYPAASSIVVCKTDVKSQTFIPLTPECNGVTAMCMSPDRKFMAVAEAGDEMPTISIIDLQTLKKRKGLQSRLVESTVRETPWSLHTERGPPVYATDGIALPRSEAGA